MRLIDADVLRTSIEKDRDASDMPKMWYEGIAYAINHIIHAPTADAVEVVRCKYCKHRDHYECNNIMLGGTKCGVTDDWFCADGERKETEDD